MSYEELIEDIRTQIDELGEDNSKGKTLLVKPEGCSEDEWLRALGHFGLVPLCREQLLIAQAGGAYVGSDSGLVYFIERQTGTTMTVEQSRFEGSDDCAIVELLKMRMDVKRADFWRVPPLPPAGQSR